MSFSEGLPATPPTQTTSPRHEKPGYVISNGISNGRESLSSSNSHTSSESTTSNKRGSRYTIILIIFCFETVSSFM